MPPIERIYPGSPAPLAGGQLYPSPIQFLFTGEDGLRVSAVNVVAGLVLRISARWQNEGETHAQSLSWTYTPTSDGNNTNLDIPLPAGVLLNLVVRPVGSIVERGQCFVRVDVIRGRGATVTLGTLLMGYVGSWGGRAWPGSPLETPVDGAGWVHRVQSATPGAGGLPFIAMPEDARWRVLTITADLTTSGAAGVRRPYAFLTQSGAIVFIAPSSLAQAPGVAQSHTFAPGLAVPEGSGVIIGQGPLPGEALLQTGAAPSAQIALGTNGLQAGDQWTALQAEVEEWRNTVSIFGD